MKYVIDLSPEVIKKVQVLIDQRKFESILQFIEVAIQNQISLEQRDPGIVSLNSESETYQKGVGEYTKRFTRPESSSLYIVEDIPVQPGLIWGLYNRFFPVKISVRVLANLSEQLSSAQVPLEQLKEEATEVALTMGKRLMLIDKQKHRQSREKLATALPFSNLERKTHRFQDMFVGSIRSNDKVEGFPSKLGFMAITSNGHRKPIASLTKAGWEFAQLPNPVLDSDVIPSEQLRPFSSDERRFLLEHLSKRTPEDYSVMIATLKRAVSSKIGPAAVDKILRTGYPRLPQSEAETIRSGVVSRLVELDLLTRKRKGLEVEYVVTPEGRSFISSLQDSGRK